MLKSPRPGIKYVMIHRILLIAPNMVQMMTVSLGTIGMNPFSLVNTLTWVIKQLFKLSAVERISIVSGFMGIPNNVVFRSNKDSKPLVVPVSVLDRKTRRS